MAQRTYKLDDKVNTVLVNKRSGTRRMSLKVKHDGAVVVTIPHGASYRQAISFVARHRQWILDQQTEPQIFKPGDLIGSRYILCEAKTKAQSRRQIVIKPNDRSPVRDQIVKQLRRDAHQYLKPRLDVLTNSFSLSTPNKVIIKNMTSRWGSCSEKQNINLSLYLIQLPDDLVDYVIIHELCHLDHLNHSRLFWQHVETILPDYKDMKKRLKQIHPGVVVNQSSF